MIYWIWLTQIPFIGPVTTRYLIKELGDAEKIYQADYETLSEMSGLSARQRESTSGIIHWKKRRGSWMIPDVLSLCLADSPDISLRVS